MNLLDDNKIKDWTQSQKLPWLLHINKASIEAALDGFALGTQKDTNWFVGQIRHAFFCSVGTNFNNYPGSLVVRKELEQISQSMADTQRIFAARSEWAESILRRHVMIKEIQNSERDPIDNKIRKTRLDDWWASGNEIMRAESEEWRRFDDALKELSFAQSLVSNAIEELCSDNAPPRWRDIQRRKERIDFAVSLSPVFEAAYTKRATINNWVNDDGKSNLGPWPEFFIRIGPMALQLTRIPDISGILKTARKLYLAGEKGDFEKENEGSISPLANGKWDL